MCKLERGRNLESREVATREIVCVCVCVLQVWSLKGFFLSQTLTDHSTSVGCLVLDADGMHLFSGSGMHTHTHTHTHEHSHTHTNTHKPAQVLDARLALLFHLVWLQTGVSVPAALAMLLCECVCVCAQATVV